MPGKVINFQTEAEKRTENTGAVETLFSYAPVKPYPRCKHSRIELDGDSRAVQCKDCGDYLDAFDVLLDYARKQRTTFREIARYEAAAAEFKRIWAGLSLTQKERRQISKAMDEACYFPPTP